LLHVFVSELFFEAKLRIFLREQFHSVAKTLFNNCSWSLCLLRQFLTMLRIWHAFL